MPLSYTASLNSLSEYGKEINSAESAPLAELTTANSATVGYDISPEDSSRNAQPTLPEFITIEFKQRLTI
jgi:hypothetical protein